MVGRFARLKWLFVFPTFLLLLTGCKPSADSDTDSAPIRHEGAEAASFSGGASSNRNILALLRKSAEQSDWPEGYRRAVEMRLLLDRYCQRAHRVAKETLMAEARGMERRRPSHPEGIRVVDGDLDGEVLGYRGAMEAKLVPGRGFRAPVLEAAGELRDPRRAAEEVREEAVAASIVMDRLGRDGLVLTLVRVLEAFGAERSWTAPDAAVKDLKRLGFPVDLIVCFPGGQGATTAEGIVRRWAERLRAGETSKSLAEEASAVPFVFKQSLEGLKVALESGEEEIGLLRTQIGGGYHNGIMPGGVLDVNAQLVERLPQVDFLMSIQAEMFPDFERMVESLWGLHRAHQLTVVREQLPVSGWPQDNGKAGVVQGGLGPELATIVPRYATVGEVPTEFVPGESFLVDGLQSAGHTVVQSPLLFQGGNILMILDAATGQRVVVLSEATVHRNASLGLRRGQVLEAFSIEFGAERCVVLPSVSHHLDFDISIRNQNGKTLAFVNDVWAASRLMLEAGLEALESGGVLDGEAGLAAREDLKAGKEEALYELLSDTLRRHADPQTGYPAGLARHFSSAGTDAAGPNLQSFLTALDHLGGRVSTSSRPDASIDIDPVRLFRRASERAVLQREKLTELGWVVVPVPSLPDLGTPVNYLNGIHDRAAYIMPVHGGFYASLDEAAAEKFRVALGPDVRLIPIETAACQQLQHGAVHCAAVAYPRLPEPPKSGT